MHASSNSQDNEGNKGEITATTKMTIYCRNYKRVCKVRGSCMWSSARMGDVDSWYGWVVDVRSWTFDEGSWRRSSRGDTARYLMRVAVSWVIECSWTIVAGSWGRSSRWMQLDDRCGKLRSVESLNVAGWSLREAEVGWVVECSWTIVTGSWSRSSLVNRCPVFDSLLG